MLLGEAVRLLKRHQRWREGDETAAPVQPDVLSEALKVVIWFCERNLRQSDDGK